MCSEFSIFNVLQIKVDENQLNGLIQRPDDIENIKALLKLKQYFVNNGEQKEVSFEFRNIINLSITYQNKLEILKDAFPVQSNMQEFNKLICYLEETVNIVKNDDDYLFLLNVFEAVLDFAVATNNKKILSILNDNLSSLFDGFLGKELVNTNVLVNVVTKCVDDLKNENILSYFYHFILKTRNLHVFCALSDYYFKKGVRTLCLINREDFWMLMEYFYSSNDMDHKEMHYILNKALNCVFQEDAFESRLVSFSANNKIEVITAWKHFFVLIEVSKEKQLYLLEPVLPFLKTICILNPLWSRYIYSIYLSHVQYIVSYYTLFIFFEISSQNELIISNSLLKSILRALNKNEYSDYSSKAYHMFHNFLENLPLTLLEDLLIVVLSMKWIPVPYYFICKSIFALNRAFRISDYMQFLTQFTHLPDKFIRNECAHMLSNHLQENCKLEIIPPEDCIKIIDALNYFDSFTVLKENVFKKHKEYFENIFLKNEYNKYSPDMLNKILIILSDCKINNQWFEMILRHKDFPKNINLLIMLHFPSFISLSEFMYYADCNFYENLDENNTKILIEVAAKVSKFKNDITFDKQDKFLSKCYNILLNSANCKSNLIPFAFEILKQYYLNFSQEEINTILNIWIDIITQGKKFDLDIIPNFLFIYNKIRLEKNVTLEKEDLEQTKNLLLQLCEVVPHNYFPNLFMPLKTLFEKTKRDDLSVVYFLVDVFKKYLLEIKKNSIFTSSLNSFLGSLLLNKSFSIDSILTEKVYEVLSNLMKDSKRLVEIPIAISKHLLHVSTQNYNLLIHFLPILVDLLLYGEVLRKDQVAEYRTYFSICKTRDLNFNNIFIYQRNKIRINIVNLIQNSMDFRRVQNEVRQTFADAFTKLLLKKFSTYFNKRHYANSQVHLNKLRILQALLVLHSHISQQNNMLDILMESLCSESNQVSVRFFIQWLLIELLSCDKDCINKIVKRVNSTSKGHPSTIISFVLVLYHLVQKTNEENSWIMVIDELIPWTMGSQFNLRFYSQMVFVKIYEKAKERKYINLTSKYYPIYKSTKIVLESTERSFDALEMFFLESFLPKEHYTLENIYIQFPKLTQVTETEYVTISVTDFISNSTLLSTNKHVISFQSPIDTSNSNFNTPNVIDTYPTVIQKKINPWKDDIHQDFKKRVGNLIVVASLIDKAPNLGGLSRTSEIFGVKKLVINSSTIIKSPEFQSLSMSSENWVDIEEVKMDKLKEYISLQKKEGYTVLGAEQTSESIKLTEFIFPKKCLLLLGNEKQGIPPNLLYLLDKCIEIPQVGVVRSLNVHVAAATIIWEYTKQHIL